MSHITARPGNTFQDCQALVEKLLQEAGPHIVLGIPLGIGKPNPLVNALYRRVAADSALSLTILTALSLEKPHGASELERRFIDPFVERVFGDYPDLEYVKARRAGALPQNVRVIEFFLKTGDYLENDVAQQDFICSNYTNAARDMLALGVNVLAQAVGAQGEGADMELSLSSNPDTTLDILARLPQLAAQGRRVLTVAAINRKLPFMTGEAQVAPACFDYILEDAASTHDLFAPPNMKVSLQDYAIGLYASSLVADGGTLQIGIGSLGDAIAHSLIMRQHNNSAYRTLMQDLGAAGPEQGEFTQGLYGCSEMFVNGFMHLIRHGVIKREVFADERLHSLLQQGVLQVELAADSLQRLRHAGVLGQGLDQATLDWLQRWGILAPQVRLQDGQLSAGGQALGSADAPDWQALQAWQGERLQGGVFMHGGFFIGPRDFYSSLHLLPPELKAKVSMRRISFINSLSGHESLARMQRCKARFINTTMMVSLLGAAASDSLDSGRVVSGVGGQYNFVAMADALPDARSILMLRATHARADQVWSNIVWSVGQTSIPRHLRDIVITEYGIADLRSKTDGECVRALLAVSDARFQDELLDAAKRHGKLAHDFQPPAAWRRNTPQDLAARLSRHRALLPDFPFGTDFSEDEIQIVKALKKLKASVGHPLDLLHTFVASFVEEHEHVERYLERMQMEEMDSLKQRLLRRLFVGNLS
ncbi:acetyl-CoA hydrolase/transferase C-terminal domain-containing protein [Massilia sp. W12]|uniref:acetyl-CoA hydrolase/transferase C-terminal domain-containing protein n=1 Tax=Massilia sp. W12 TaxID=3126507 RepID=UPI0030D45FF9